MFTDKCLLEKLTFAEMDYYKDKCEKLITPNLREECTDVFQHIASTVSIPARIFISEQI